MDHGFRDRGNFASVSASVPLVYQDSEAKFIVYLCEEGAYDNL